MMAEENDDFFDDQGVGSTLVDADGHDEDDDEDTSNDTLKKWAIRGGIAAGAVVGAVVIAVGGFLAGSSAAEQSQAPVAVSEIKSANSTLDQLETLKDSQIESLTNQLAKVQPKSGSSSGTESVEVNSQTATTVDTNTQKTLATLLNQSAKDQENIDKFLDQVMAVSPTADEGEKQSVVASLKELMTEDAGSSTAYNILNGESASRTLNEQGRKASKSNIWMASIDDAGRTYVAVTPFATKEGLHHQMAMIKIANGGQISNYQFIGMVDSSNSDAVEKTLAEFTK